MSSVRVAFEPISPELVLVSPELGAAARAALPSIWDLPAGSRQMLVPREAETVPSDTSRQDTRTAGLWTRSFARVPALVVTAAALVVLGLPAFFVFGPRPTLKPARPEPVERAELPAAPASAARPPAPAPRGIAEGLFTTSSVGRFLVERGEREIEWFDLTACGLSGRVGPIQVSSAATFSFTGPVADGRLAVSGAFVSPTFVRGMVTGSSCPARIRFGARR